MSYGDRPFGLREVKITDSEGNQVALPVPRVLAFTERVVTNELMGGDALADVAAYPDAVEWSLESGGIPVEVYAMLTGREAAETGTTPSRTNTLKVGAGSCYPYVTITGRALGPGCDGDTHVTLHRAKITGNIAGQFQNGEFYVYSCSGLAVHDDDAGAIMTIEQHETATVIPSPT